MRDPRIWSHGRFLSYAAVLSSLFLLAKLAGLQAHTSVLAGTHSGSYMAQYWGVVYLILYITFVCLVPILVIAGSLLFVGGRWARGARDEAGTEAMAADDGATETTRS